MASDSGSSHADEEEEDELPSDSSRLSPDIQRVSARADGDTYATEDQGDGEGSSESSRSSLEVLLPEHRRGDPSIIPWAQRIGIDPQKMHVMHASFFPGPESAETAKQLNAEKPDRARWTPNGLHRKHSRESEGDGLRAATTQEVCRPFTFSFPSRIITRVCVSGPPLPMMSNPSLFDPLANTPEWSAPPPL
jgi:nuclear pore complex protein Nup98-Nup96